MVKASQLLAILGATILAVGAASVAEAHGGGGRMAWRHGGHHHMQGDRHNHDRHHMNGRHENFEHRRVHGHPDHRGRGNIDPRHEILPRNAGEPRRADEIMPRRNLR